MKAPYSKVEQETIIIYNNAEKTARCTTHDKALIRKLDEMCEKSDEIKVIEDNGYVKVYEYPKKWTKVNMPRQISDEQRERMAALARERFGHK